jgi:hypothetical protein
MALVPAEPRSRYLWSPLDTSAWDLTTLQNRTKLLRMSPHSSRLAYYAPHGRTHAQSELSVDVCILGATSAGVAAALQAMRLDRSVAVVESSNHAGGISAAGLGWTDFGNKETVGGIAREFYRETGRHYGTSEAWQFEPHVAEQVFNRWLREIGAPVFFREYLAGVRKDGNRIAALHLESGLVIRARMFIDASYEGDLLEAAGASFATGRESNATYGETINGMQIHGKHQFDYPVDPYRQPGVSSSGLLPGIDTARDYALGAGDRRIQAYNFRMCLTDVPDNRRPFIRPVGYDRNAYELFARYLQGGWDEVFAKFDRIPGGKTDTNNHGAVSTDFIGGSHAWPTAGHTERENIFQAHVTYQQGLQWFLSHDPAVPASIRERYLQWGLPRDEFAETGGWPHALYVREARRLLGDYVITENDCRGLRACDDPVALGAYGMDSHNCRRLLLDGRLWNEGDVQAAGFPPYPISYRAIVPKRGECENLLVPVCVSASHIAFGSIRMEPVFMMLGQAAATAAAHAIESRSSVQDVDYAGLRQSLRRDGQVLSVTGKAARANEIV